MGWKRNDLTTITGAPPGGDPIGYVLSTDNTQHVFYLFVYSENVYHIRELIWDSKGWHDNGDLNLQSGAPPAVPRRLSEPRGRLCAYPFQAQNTQHVIYSSSLDLHFQELWWDDAGWHYKDITAESGAPSPAGASDGIPVGYAFETEGTQHVMYLSFGDNRVHELYWDKDGWHHNDLNDITGAPSPGAPNVIPVAYPFEGQFTQHVVYIDTDFHSRVHELYWDRDGWHHNDLIAASGGPFASTSGSLAAYMFASQNTQHVIYVAIPGHHIIELWWSDGKGWQSNDLTVSTGAPLPDGGRMIGYSLDSQGTQHLIYIGDPDGGLHELWWDGSGWHHNDLSTSAGLKDYTLINCAYAFEAQGTQHILYEADSHIIELYWTPDRTVNPPSKPNE